MKGSVALMEKLEIAVGLAAGRRHHIGLSLTRCLLGGGLPGSHGGLCLGRHGGIVGSIVIPVVSGGVVDGVTVCLALFVAGNFLL